MHQDHAARNRQPRYKNRERRSHRCVVMLTPSEAERVQACAELSGLSFSQTLLKAAAPTLGLPQEGGAQ